MLLKENTLCPYCVTRDYCGQTFFQNGQAWTCTRERSHLEQHVACSFCSSGMRFNALSAAPSLLNHNLAQSKERRELESLSVDEQIEFYMYKIYH